MKYCAAFCVCVLNVTETEPAVSSLPNFTFWVTIALTQLLVHTTSSEQMDLKRDTHSYEHQEVFLVSSTALEEH